MANRPVDRLQAFLAAIAGDESAPELEPRDQMEYYLEKMAERIGNIQPGPGPGPERPYPYSIPDWYVEHSAGYHDHGMTLQMSNWNHFKLTVVTTETSTGTAIDFFTGASANGAESGGTAAVLTLPAYLTFRAGDQVELRYKNIVNANAMPYTGRVYTAETGAQITALQFARATDATDKTLTTTISADTAVGSIGLYFVRTGFVAGDVFECDIELYVNRQRWI